MKAVRKLIIILTLVSAILCLFIYLATQLHIVGAVGFMLLGVVNLLFFHDSSKRSKKEKGQESSNT